jgi:hypothetical protein
MILPKLRLMNKVLSLALNKNTDDLVKVLSGFDYPAFNRKPAAGGWTAGEIAEHLLLFDIRVNTVLAEKSEETDRDPQDQVTAIRDRLIDRDNTIDAPPFLMPSDVAKDPIALRDKIVAERRKLNQALLDNNLSGLYIETPHRLFGPLTGIEWINLLIHHCNRHLIQIDSLK